MKFWLKDEVSLFRLFRYQKLPEPKKIDLPEVHSTVNFLLHLQRFHGTPLTEIQLEKYGKALISVMCIRYRDHWFLDTPMKGSGYRAIRFNGKFDHIISSAADKCFLSPKLVTQYFPEDSVIWVDPGWVEYRIGMGVGSNCTLYKADPYEPTEPWIYRPNPEKFEHIMERLSPSYQIPIEELAAYVLQ